MEALLVSACLMGFNCKYSGGNNALPPEALEELKRRYRLIPVCPEAAGGLPTPRVPSERRGDRVITRDGRDPCSRATAPPAAAKRYTTGAFRVYLFAVTG